MMTVATSNARRRRLLKAVSAFDRI